ncbi:exonuclease SbcCD subunit D [Anaerotignum lactatifermentans]|uniref:Nuclease SbcCD subunit D n=1 Tax=Anaerotignum lactatifermentans TaxID=160404 RepID=A0ABS2G7K4_9FIRM|nr:exonuclease SbcCD subunit D [Anaerotignum lactatifermentans]MBM6828099.1 exonuclease SbcCD subunit D [Anaerotignum lactatifermentans]MBM6876738.1 exonuclease SbcCD subunit D [Anaerotignum lactatifermentans]MBM6949682.1 exonuclease SbcCD subunit D [Anaerotignum lactatifermentans]
MKYLHLSDLHLGKRVNGFSMIEDQRYILEQIVEIIGEERPDGVLLAGDIYDKSVPSAEAVQLFDWFLSRLAEKSITVFAISGNHDSAERLAFGASIMAPGGVYFSPVYDGKVTVVTQKDDFGEIDIYLLPFLKPALVRPFFPEEKIETYTDALKKALECYPLHPQRRNILLTHQFVAGAERCESEEIYAGGTEAVDLTLFREFDYVALGHLHGPQNVGRENIRYCGTPLKYSFSEAKHQKSVTVVELEEKGSLRLRTILLKPLRDLREIRGNYMELTAKAYYEGMCREDYLHITLTDEEDIFDAAARLRVIYPNLMKLDYDNQRTRMDQSICAPEEVEQKTPLDLFGEFYALQNNQPMSAEQEKIIRELAEQIWEGEA